MLALNDVHRSQPIYLCGTHVAKIGRSPAASTSGTSSPESAPVPSSSKVPAANSKSVANTPRRRRYPYILLLLAILALAGVFLGPRLFRTIPQQSSKPAPIAEPPKVTASSKLPQKAPRKAPPKDEPAAPHKRSQPVPKQAVPNRTTQPPKRSVPTANVAAKGTVAQRVLPDVPKSASDTIRGTILVSVRVQVDASGNVEDTKLVFPGPSRYFARLAVESARRWKFNPPVVAGQDSPSEWLIRFYYTRQATKAAATQAVSAGTPRK
jgi:TonB family protein